MDRSFCYRAAAGLLVWAAVCLPSSVAGQVQGVSSVRRVQVLGNRNPVEIEIESSDRLVPQTQVLTGPDRLVVDFANAVPGTQLRNQSVNRGEVKSVRVSLFSSKPPVTRVVFDLRGPQHYQVFPYGRTVMVKVGAGAGAEAARLAPSSGSGSGPSLVNTTYPAQSVPSVVARTSAASASGFIPGRIAHDQCQQSQPVGDSFCGTPAHRGGDCHPGRRGAGESGGRDRSRFRARSARAPAERFEVQFRHYEFGERPRHSRPRHSECSSGRAGAGLSSSAASAA